MTVTVTIGNNSAKYHVKQTRAPKAYDGFGTFTLQHGLPDDNRLVMVRDEHLRWQEGRNGSGLGTFLAEPQGFDLHDVEVALWNKLAAEPQPEQPS